MNLYLVSFSYIGYSIFANDSSIALIRAENYSIAEQQAKTHAEQNDKKIINIRLIDETEIDNKLLLIC